MLVAILGQQVAAVTLTPNRRAASDLVNSTSKTPRKNVQKTHGAIKAGSSVQPGSGVEPLPQIVTTKAVTLTPKSHQIVTSKLSRRINLKMGSKQVLCLLG